MPKRIQGGRIVIPRMRENRETTGIVIKLTEEEGEDSFQRRTVGGNLLIEVGGQNVILKRTAWRKN